MLLLHRSGLAQSPSLVSETFRHVLLHCAGYLLKNGRQRRNDHQLSDELQEDTSSWGSTQEDAAVLLYSPQAMTGKIMVHIESCFVSQRVGDYSATTNTCMCVCVCVWCAIFVLIVQYCLSDR